MAKQTFQNVRGTYDILPEDQLVSSYLTRTFMDQMQAAGFGMIATPMMEDAAVFSRSVGDSTDIVEKEMYVFEDRGGDKLALRPEGTAGVVRSYIQHGLASKPKPVKLAYVGPMFRYDRPQAGRFRQFYQLGAEVFGEAAPSVDAGVIMLALRYFKAVGITDVSLQINSLGDSADRAKYQKALVAHLESGKSQLAPLDQQRLTKNPLRVLDSKEPASQTLINEAPQIMDFLCEDCREHFRAVLEYLDEMGVSYELNPRLVRGLDYYNRTAFEFYGEREGAQASLGGGGRYDGLVELLGGVPTPAVGWALGVERLVLEMEGRGVNIPAATGPVVYVASLGEPARLAGFRLLQELLDAGVPSDGSVERDGIGGQLERAHKLGAQWAIIIGQKEVLEKAVILRDMSTGAQEMIPLTKIVAELTKRAHQL